MNSRGSRDNAIATTTVLLRSTDSLTKPMTLLSAVTDTPSPAFPDQTYPKTGNGVVVSIFCIPATGTNSIDTTSGLPGPGALVTPGSQTWIK